MKKCPNCSAVFNDDMNNCMNCGTQLVEEAPVQQPVNPIPPVNNNYNQYNAPQFKYCPRCGNQCDPKAVICVRCGISLGNAPDADDKPTGILKFLCFFIPVLGLILYVINMKDKPISAKAYGKMALIGFITQIIVYILYMIIMLVIFPLVFSFSAFPEYEYAFEEEFYYSMIQGITAIFN